jgi:two-component system phosphate regulon sensor histidine kinase PhoR
MNMKRPYVIFYSLLIYAMAEVIWWGLLLVRSQPDRKGMIMGEGAVFLFIFIVGGYSLHKAIKKEKKLQKQQKNFLLSVTHELKSPLASIKLYLQTILKRELDKEKQKSFLTKSLVDIERLHDLVENMLLASKIDGHSYSFPKEKFNLSELVEDIVSRLQVNKCDLNQQTVSADIDRDIEIEGDRFSLSAMVNNLIENAIKYSGPCEVVKVKLFRKNNAVHLMVADHGIGIPDVEKHKIFDMFYRVGNEDTRNTKGTGLGLYIVKQVAEKHLANIFIRDNRPTGTIFEVVFA